MSDEIDLSRAKYERLTRSEIEPKALYMIGDIYGIRCHEMTREVLRFPDGTVYICRTGTGFVGVLTVQCGEIEAKVDPGLGAIFLKAPGVTANVYSDETRKEQLEAFEMFEEGEEVSSAHQVLDAILRYMKDTLGVELPGVMEALKQEKPSS